MSRSNESVPVVACEEAPTQRDHSLLLAGNRRLLVSTWMPPSLYQQNFAADDGVTYNLENDTNAYMAIHAPSATVEGGSGTLHSQGFLVQSIGYFVDTRADNDRYLVGEAGSAGRVRAWTTHRFAACDDQVFLENTWRNEANNRVVLSAAPASKKRRTRSRLASPGPCFTPRLAHLRSAAQNFI